MERVTVDDLRSGAYILEPRQAQLCMVLAADSDRVWLEDARSGDLLTKGLEWVVRHYVFVRAAHPDGVFAGA